MADYTTEWTASIFIIIYRYAVMTIFYNDSLKIGKL